RISRLRLVQWAHRGKDPQCLRIEGVAPPLGDAVAIDGRVGECGVSLGETVRGVEFVAGETATSLVHAGVIVEVGVTAAYGAPVEEGLIFRVLFREHAVQ